MWLLMADDDVTKVSGSTIIALICIIVVAIIIIAFFGRQIMYFFCRLFLHYMPVPLSAVFGGHWACGWLL